MSNTHLNIIKELIVFYVKSNYEDYLQTNNITVIKDDNIDIVVTQLYEEKKDHMKEFIKESFKKLCKVNDMQHPGDLIINNLLTDIINDKRLCISKIITEIKKFQND